MIGSQRTCSASHRIVAGLLLAGWFVPLLSTLAVLPVAAWAGVMQPLVRLGDLDPALASSRLPEMGEGTSQLQTNIPITFGGADVGQLIGADRFYTNGITGQGSITANVEGGHIWNGHETLGHVTQFTHDVLAWNNPGTPGNQLGDLIDRHATWVGMHIGGRNGGPSQGSFQTGIAPGTDLRSGAIANQFLGSAFSANFNFSQSSFTTPYATYFGTADVINTSWGGVDPPGLSNFTIALDGLADSFPSTTFVAAAGNRADPDQNPATPPVTNSVSYPGSGYNSITVAALANNGNNVYDAVADFSSRGPQDWGFVDFGLGAVFGCGSCRAAVDIAAPGTSLVSAYYGGATGGNNPTLPGSPNGPAGGPDYYTTGLGGTSLAAPITAGGAALLVSASYNTPALAANPASRDARVIKAVLMNSADKIPGWDNDQYPHPNGNGGVLTVQSLDYASGAGALNLDRAYDQYIGTTTKDVPGTPSGNQGLVDPVGWDFGRVVDGTDNVYPIDDLLSAGSMLTATLTWFRDRDFNPQLVLVAENAEADLDLVVRDTLTGQIISESISAFNNAEHLHFALPRTSRYQIEVVFFGALFGNVAAEDYGLAWSVAVPEPTGGMLAAIAGLALLFRSGRRFQHGGMGT
jgi:hypothetical protein